MERLKLFVFALMAILPTCAIWSQGLTIDLTELDSGFAVYSQVVAGDVLTLDSAITDTVKELEINAANSVLVQLKYDATHHSCFRLTLTPSGTITNVDWKPDPLESGEYAPMDTSMYQLSSSNKEIKFEVCSIAIDLDDLSYRGFQIEYYDPSSGSSSLFNDTESGGTFELVPGHYLISNSASNSSIHFLVDDQCIIHENVEWRLNSEDPEPWSLFHSEFYEIEPETLRLLGTDIDFRFAIGSSQTAQILGFGAGDSQLYNLETHTSSLNPGRYTIEVTNGTPATWLQFDLLNQTGRLQNQLMWQDLTGISTDAELTPLPLGFVFVQPSALSSTKTMPFTFPEAELPYAILKDQLDGDYYLAIGGELRLRYDERYATNADLNLRILDMDAQEVTLSSPVGRQYGTNWITLQLPSTDFTVGDYYVLEVRGPKGDLSMLRFRYDL